MEKVINFYFRYKLVSYTENSVNLSIVMGAPKGVMWMLKFFDERFTVQDVGPDGLIKFVWNIRWKFSNILIKTNFCGT